MDQQILKEVEEELESQSESHDSQLIAQPQVYIKENIQDIIKQQPIFFETEIQSGNFDLLVLNMPENIDELDSTGYSLLSHAISFGRLDVIDFLLAKGANPNLKSILGQSYLMLACHFGIKEVIQKFIDLGNDINESDQRQFTPLLYAVKNKQQLIALYLISLGANIKIKDSQECTPIHWAAYNNDIYLLQYFEEEQNINQIDLQGKTPLDRALSNFSFKSVRYILQHYPELIPSKKVDLKSQCVEETINEIRINIKLKSLNVYFRQYTILIIISGFQLLLQCQNFIRTNDDDSFGYGIQLVSLLLLLYTYFYTIIFYHKTTNKQTDGKHIQEKLGHPKMHFQCSGNNHNHDHHQILAEDDYQLEVNHNDLENQDIISELLHAVKSHFENSEIHNNLDLTRTCSKCKIIQSEQIVHCFECNICVNGYHFHSILFNKCINNSNHFFYFLLVFSYFISSITLVFTYLYTINQQKIAFYFKIFVPLFTGFNIFEIIAYILLWIILYISIINLFLCISCIICNLTEQEILQANEFKYLYEITKIKTFYFMRPKSIKDIVDNVQSYIWKQFNDLKIV